MWRWVLCVGLLAIAGCKNPDGEPPVPQQQMRAILLDMQVVEARLQVLLPTEYARDSVGKIYYLQVLRAHKLSPDAFRAAWNYYVDHPRLLQQVQDSVLVDLSILQAKLPPQKGPVLPSPPPPRNPLFLSK